MVKSPSVTISRAMARDAEGIHRLLEEVAAESPFLGDWGAGIQVVQLQKFLEQPGDLVRILVAHNADMQVIGYNHLINNTVFGLPHTMAHAAQIAVAVDKAYRGQGIAERLVAGSIALAAEVPTLRVVRASIWENNIASIHVFARAGFHPVASIPEQFFDHRSQEYFAEVLMSFPLEAK